MAPRKKRGCLFYGCLSLVAVGVVVILTFLLGFYFTTRWVSKTLTGLTEARPAAFEVVRLSPAEEEEIQQRMRAFFEAAQRGQGGVEIVLTARDLNYLLSRNPDLRERLFVDIQDDRIRGKVSLPLDQVVPPEVRSRLGALRGRYLNGTAVFRVALEGGVLDVRVEELEAAGKPLDKIPLVGRLVAELRQRNLANDPQVRMTDTSNLMARCESLVVKDGALRLRTKASR